MTSTTSQVSRPDPDGPEAGAWPEWSRQWFRQWSSRWAWLVTPGAVVLLQLLVDTPVHITTPGIVLIFAVGVAAFREGLVSGLISAAIAIAYVWHHGTSQVTAAYTGADARRDVIVSTVLLLVALIGRVMRRRLQQVIEQERDLRRAADGERQRSLNILDTMSDGFITITRDWRITFANRRAAEILDVPRERMVGANALAVFRAARGSTTHRTLANAFAAGVPAEVEDHFALTDSWFEIRVYPTDREFSIYFRDVTPRHRAQESILFQSRLLDAIGQAAIATDLDGLIIYWNRAAEAVFGWSAQEVVGKCRIGVTQAGYTAADDAKLSKRMRTGQPWLGEALLQAKNGNTFSAALADAPIIAEDGSLVGVVRIVTDLTSRKTIEEEHRFLAVASAALATTLDVESTIRTLARLSVPTLADGCMVDLLDEDGAVHRLEVVHANPKKQQIAQEIKRRYSAPATYHPMLQVIRTGQSQLVPRISEEVLRTIALDARHLGLLRDLAYRSAMIVPVIAHGRVLGAITLLSDQPNREFKAVDLRAAEELAGRAAVAIENARLYEAAVVASRAKSDFLAVMSHELRTPLTTVMGYTDLLLAGVPRPLEDKALLYIERIRTAAWHLLGIIEQILIYARLEGGREQLHPQRVDVANVLTEAAALIEPVAEEKGLGFQVQAPPDLSVETDPTKLRQILLNLLSNAVKFTEHGVVRLEAHATARQIIFLVRDTGIGIAAEDLPRVFDAFWQVDQSATRQVGGTGLGLSVARRLARLLGGEITVESESGTGTTFLVELPLRWGQGLAGSSVRVEGQLPDGRVEIASGSVDDRLARGGTMP